MKSSAVRKGAVVKKRTQRDGNTTLSDNSVHTNAIRNLAVTADKVGPDAITPEKIDSSTVDYILKHYKNALINGDMAISQRGTSFASAASGQYTVDRFVYGKSGAMVHTITQDTDVPTTAQAGYAFKHSLRLNLTTPDTSLAAGDIAYIQQAIEGYNFKRLAEKAFTLSFWVKATTPGVYCVAFANSTPDRSYVAEYTIDSANTWEKKTITVSASPSDGTWNFTNGVGLYVIWTIAAGTTYQATAGAWTSGFKTSTSGQVNGVNTGATDFRITGAMLNEGEIAAPFSLFGGSVADEFQNCLRYYWQPNHTRYLGHGYFDSATSVVARIELPVPMRAEPSSSVSIASAFNANRAGSSATTSTGVSFTAQGQESIGVIISGLTASTTGFGTLINLANPNTLFVSAEL